MKRFFERLYVRHQQRECARGLEATLVKLRELEQRRVQLECHRAWLYVEASRLAARELDLSLPGRRIA